MGELVKNELLAVQRGVAARVEHEVFGVGNQPECADAVAGVEVREFYDTKSAMAPFLNGLKEVLKREAAAEPEFGDGYRYGFFGVHGLPPFGRACNRLGFVAREARQGSGVRVNSSSRNVLMAWSALGEMSPSVRAA